MLTPLQHLTVKYLASGWSVARTAEELKLPVHQINKWKQDEEFQAALARGIEHHEELVEALLLEGEAKAAETLIAALSASGKAGPNWSVRVTAAVTLLDRAGKRGKAIERQMQAVAHVGRTGQDVEASLKKALRDPGVRAWLKETGAAASLAEIDVPEQEQVQIVPPPLLPEKTA